MKRMSKLILSLMICMSLGLMQSCDEDEVVYLEGGLLQSLESFITITNTVFSFKTDVNALYVSSITLVPGVQDGITTLRLVKTFTDGATGEVSQPVNVDFTVDGTQNSIVVDLFLTYEDLKEGIQNGGSALPEDPVEIADDSKWVYSVKALNADGSEAFQHDGGDIEIGKNPYAGVYRVLYSDYWRIEDDQYDSDGDGVNDTDLPLWTDEERVIGAQSKNALLHFDWYGPFGLAEPFVFFIDFDNPNGDGSFPISIPTEIDGVPQPTSSGPIMISCQSKPNAFNHGDFTAWGVNEVCDTRLVPDAVEGKHLLILTYGYELGTGEREFYEVLEKQP